MIYMMSPQTSHTIQIKSQQGFPHQLLSFSVFSRCSSGYRIFTAEHMRTNEIKALPSTERIKAVASKWRDLSAYGKKRYEAKKEKLMKEYKKEIDKYKKVGGSTTLKVCLEHRFCWNT